MSDGVTWSVVSQTETSGQDSRGAYVQGVRVSFQTSNGITGSVFIPDSEYNAEVVRARVQARVDAMTGVHTLEG